MTILMYEKPETGVLCRHVNYLRDGCFTPGSDFHGIGFWFNKNIKI